MVKRSMIKVVDEDFSSVFEIISCRRNRALMAVNVELLMTYWVIGAFLSPRIHAGSWDASVVGRLADYLKRQDPTLRGYGKSNLYNMAKVYDVFSSEAFSTLNDRHQKQLTAGLDFFQLPTGKSGVVGGGAKIVVEYAMSRTVSPVMVAQYKRQFIPKEVLQRTFEEYLALPETIEA